MVPVECKPSGCAVWSRTSEPCPLNDLPLQLRKVKLVPVPHEHIPTQKLAKQQAACPSSIVQSQGMHGPRVVTEQIFLFPQLSWSIIPVSSYGFWYIATAVNFAENVGHLVDSIVSDDEHAGGVGGIFQQLCPGQGCSVPQFPAQQPSCNICVCPAASYYPLQLGLSIPVSPDRPSASTGKYKTKRQILSRYISRF